MFDDASPTVFAGTASSYARFRPPYPEALLSDLRCRAGLAGDGSLLDLACGPGRVAIPMAPHVYSVVAVDVEPDMIAVAKAEAARCGVTNVAWLVRRAEDLELPARCLDLVTVGEAFHRLDPERVLTRALRWLRPRGAIATLGGEPVWRGEEPWKRAVVEVVNAWTDRRLGEPNEGGWGGPVDELRAAGLTVEEREWTVEEVWTCDSVVGFLFSTSFASRRALGDGAGAFESQLREALLDVEPSGRFAASQRFGYTLGTKDGDDA